MFYFIPAWYNDSRPWYDNNDIWHRNWRKKGFDDTVNQAKIFNEQGEEIKLLILNYSPNLRYHLHSQDLLEVNYWSLFDELQNIKGNNIKIVDHKIIPIDDDVKLIYTPFNIVLQKENRSIGSIEFSEDGNINYLEYEFNSNKIKYIFDDRGFISSTIHYEGEMESYQQFLNEEGKWQFRENLGEKKTIEINPDFQYRFNKEIYNDITELIEEQLGKYCKKNIEKTDNIVIAAHDDNYKILNVLPKESKKIFSFFGNRSNEIPKDYEDNIHAVVTDTQYRTTYFKNILSSDKIYSLTPYDTRLSLGSSQSLKELKVFINLVGAKEQEIRELVEILVPLTTNNRDLMLLFSADSMNEKIIQETVDKYIMEDEDDEEELVLLEETKVESKIEVFVINKEIDLIRKLNESRIIVDLSNEPDVQLQIAGISAGIPQINKIENMYVLNKKNGLIIESIGDLKDALDYYLIGLKNWNESLIFSIKQIEKYTGEKLVAYWKNYVIGD